MFSPLLLGTGNARERTTRMGLARITVGLSTVNTGIGAKIFGAPAEQITTATRLLARLFAVRNIVLGIWTLAVRDASTTERQRCFRLNLAVDVADLAVAVPALLQRDLRRTAVMSIALALSATLGWLQILQEG